jgi:transaldolase
VPLAIDAVAPEVRYGIGFVAAEGRMDAASNWNLDIDLYADIGSLAGLSEALAAGWARGFTTNPTLMKQEGVSDFGVFVERVVAEAGARPLSLPILVDDPNAMEEQALRLAAFGPNIFVKIPITDSRGALLTPLVGRLARQGVKVNVTALLTLEQVRAVSQVLVSEVPSIVSVFAGRIADTGRDPVPSMREARAILAPLPEARLLWASPRELLNVFQANAAGSHIVTLSAALWRKLPMIGKDLSELSLETVQMFHRDVCQAGYRL